MWVGIVVVGLPLLLIALFATPPVTRFVVRRALPMLNEGLNGRITVAGVGGSLLGRVRLEGVVVHGPEGEVVVQVDHAELNYSIRDLLRSRFTIDPLILERPLVRLLKTHPGEPYTLLQVFERTGNGQPATGTVDLTIRRVAMRGGTLIVTIWREPVDPEAEGPQPLDTVRLQDVDLRLPLLHYSAGPDAPRMAMLEVDSGRAHLVHPELDLYALRGKASLRNDSITVALQSVQLPQSRFSADAWLVTATAGSPQRRFEATAHVRELVAGDVKGLISGADIPADWSLRGDLRVASQPTGAVLAEATNLDIDAAGGTIRGRVAVVGDDDDWTARSSRVELTGIELAQLLRAFDVRSTLRGRVGGVVTAQGRSGSADLQLDGVSGYGVRGAGTGRLRASGSLDALTFDTRLAGEMGRVWLAGRVTRGGGHMAVRQARGELERFDIAALDARLPPTRLNARLEGDVVFGSLLRAGYLRLFVDSSTVRGMQIDTAAVIARVDSAGGLVLVDSLFVRSSGLEANGGGTLGLDADHAGEILLEVKAASLSDVEPLVTALTGDTVDLAGTVSLNATVRGSVSAYDLALELTGTDLVVSGFAVRALEAGAAGTLDSLVWTAHAELDDETEIAAAGAVAPRVVALDSLVIARRDAVWVLDDTAQIEFRDDSVRFDRAALRRSPASGVVTVAGTVPGELTVEIERLPLEDVIGDSDEELPELAGRVTYRAGAVTGTITLVGPEDQPQLTLELATQPFRATLSADSVNLEVLEPLLPNLRDIGGRLSGNVTAQGSDDQPQLEGRLELIDAAATVPALGVRYGNIGGVLTFAGDAVRFDSLQLDAGGGRARISGAVQFARLREPAFDLTVRTDEFAVIGRRDFLETSASGELRLRGPLLGATLTGRIGVVEGVAHMDHFLQPTGISLSDPLYAQFVDTTVLQQEHLAPGPLDRFTDRLRIETLVVDLGDDFWLRSDDANIQLGGRLEVSKVPGAEDYRLVGTVTAVRGTYRLTLAPGVRREFSVREGSIRFFGAPDTDARLDLKVEHLVHTARGERITITADITGTIAEPVMGLRSDVNPPLSETEIMSYLLFGAPTVQAFLGSGGSQRRSVFEQSVERFVGILSGQLERAVVEQLGLPVDYFRIKPGEVQSGLSGTELLIGKQVDLFGQPAFLQASPRLCPREQLLSLEQIGISLETRISPEWGATASIDPVRGCEAIIAGSATVPYQLGFDVFWEKR